MNILMKEFVGVILPDGIYNVLMKGKNQINVDAYQDAAEKYNLIPVFLRVKDIKPGTHQIQAFIKRGTEYKIETFDLPKVIYSRSFLNKRQIKFLINHDIAIYNTKGISQNKYQMHKIINEKPELRPYLPHTEKGTIENLQTMMQEHTKLILKPANGSLGGGIIKLEKDNEGMWIFHYPIARRTWEEIIFYDELPQRLINTLKKKTYIIQEKIELATYQDLAFDLRVVVQRGDTGAWVLAGILCKVAANKDRFVTNISQGGSSLSFDRVFKSHPYLSYDKVYQEVSTISLDIAKHLENYTDHIADIALDLAVDQEGHPYFIESNFRGRYGNVRYKGKRLEEWKAKHTNPIGYARYLLDQKSAK